MDRKRTKASRSGYGVGKGSPRARLRTQREFTYVIEEEEDGMLIASVPGLPGCFTQARSLPQLDERVKEAIGVYLESFPEAERKNSASGFIALRRVAV